MMPSPPSTPLPIPMKITQIATGAIFLLLLVAGYLMMDSANDKKFALMQDKLNKLTELAEKKPAPPPAPTPASVEVPDAPTDVAVPPKPVKPAVVKAAPTPAPAEAPGTEIALPDPAADLKLAPGERALLVEVAEKINQDSRPKSYTPLQVKIKSLPAIAKVKSFNADYGFVELDAGKNRNLETGMSFDIRRDAMIVGKVRIGDTVEDALCIADVDPKSVPVGVVLQAGDEIIQMD